MTPPTIDAPPIGKDSALRLLERSISYGHPAIAVVRLSIAVRLGAAVQSEHWAYCRDAVEASGDAGLSALLQAAEFASAQRAPDDVAFRRAASLVASQSHHAR